MPLKHPFMQIHLYNHSLLSVLFFALATLLVLNLCLFWTCIVLFSHLLVCTFVLCLQFKLRSCNLLQSGIPRNAAPLPGATKRLLWCWILLLFLLTLHTPICSMHEVLHVYIIIFCLLNYLDIALWIFWWTLITIGIHLIFTYFSTLHSLCF